MNMNVIIVIIKQTNISLGLRWFGFTFKANACNYADHFHNKKEVTLGNSEWEEDNYCFWTSMMPAHLNNLFAN